MSTTESRTAKLIRSLEDEIECLKADSKRLTWLLRHASITIRHGGRGSFTAYGQLSLDRIALDEHINGTVSNGEWTK